ncbi:MAG: hypothetical protein KDE27_21465, partial [Planctomycetes bacterium]|nr:hypothetical protein [Planctomycetota bacterium]
GRASDLAASERQRQLRELLGRAATAAFHLGFAPDEIERALSESLDELRFTTDANANEKKTS